MRPIRVRRISRFQRFLLNLKAVRRSIAGQRSVRLIMRTAAVVVLLIITMLWWGSFYRPHQDISNAFSQDMGSLQSTTEPSASSESIEIDDRFAARPLAAPASAHLAVQTAMTSVAPTLAMPDSKTSQPVHEPEKPASSTASASSATTAATAATARPASVAVTSKTASPPTTAATQSVYDNVTVNATQFPGIAILITEKWQFPLKIAPTTPGIGLFGATRSNRRSHAGIDLYAAPGTLVYAMTDGKVRNVEVFYQSLLAIEVENLDGTTIRYGELDSLVQIGDTVRQGQPIGKLRRNYDRTCMLHLEIYATISTEPLTDLEDKSVYLYVPVSDRSYRRRGDLVDPSAVYSLRRP